MPARSFVATLVAATGGGLLPAFVQAFAGRLEKEGAADLCRVWLEPGRAIDIFYQGADLSALAHQLLADEAADCIIQPVDGRAKKLLLADMESTIIEQEMLDELAETIGLRDKVAAITARAMNGELDFAAALGERVGLLRGLPVAVLDRVADRITLMPGAEALLATMKAKGAAAWLVSGGFTCFARPVAERLGFDRVFANELILRDGVITGEVTQPILDKNSKKNLLGRASAELGLALRQTVTVGDGANDIPMLSACNEGGGLGVAFHAKPSVRAAVLHQINHGDLGVLLYAQGYEWSRVTSLSGT
jgi:phosphoserine phosphatase